MEAMRKGFVKQMSFSLVRATVMRWCAQDEVNQEESEQDEVDGIKKGADW